MKNFVFILILWFPYLLTFLFISRTIIFEKNLVPINETLSLYKDDGANSISRENNYIEINNAASRNRIIFFVNKNGKKIKYQRTYRGFITGWYKSITYKKLKSKNNLSFYIKDSTNELFKETVPFFGLNQKDKNFSFFYDIYLFFRDKYFFLFILGFLAYIFGAG